MRNFFYLSFILTLISCSTPQLKIEDTERVIASATETPCQELVRSLLDQKAFEATNIKFAQKYPNFEAMLKNPGDYFEEMKLRFALQKKLTPNDPYRFDFSEYGIPVIKELRNQITEKEDEFVKNLDLLKTAHEDSTVPEWIKNKFPILFSRPKQIKDQELGLKYLREVKAELDSYLAKDSIDYKSLQEISFFYSRASGAFDEKKLNLRDRMMLVIDRHLQGYNKLTIEQEYTEYQNRTFKVFHKDSPVDGFINAQAPFENAFADNDELIMLSLPTPEHLGPDIFMRLMPYNIYINGISLNPAAADGFVRPSGDFWLHDLRHASAIYEKRLRYMDKYQISEEAFSKLQLRMDRWKMELDEERKKIENKELRYAIGFFMFNHHHDRGFPMVPSTYLNNDKENISYLLYTMLKVSNQPTGFKRPRQTLDEAYSWLQDFWLKRLDEEMEIINSKQ